MSVDIKGLDKLLNKLNKLSNIQAKVAVEKVASEIENAIKSEAQTFSEKEFNHIGRCEVRDYGTSYFVEIGLKGSNAPFDAWKGLYFNNYGFMNELWGTKSKGDGVYTAPHLMWFQNSVKKMEGPVLDKLQADLKRQIRNVINS